MRQVSTTVRDDVKYQVRESSVGFAWQRWFHQYNLFRYVVVTGRQIRIQLGNRIAVMHGDL